MATTTASPPPKSPAIDRARETTHALRVATASALCLLVVALLHLPHGNLAVWTTYMVMAQYAFTAFQKGLERILGRGLGILAGLVVLMLFRNVWQLGFLVELLLIVPFFYAYFADRLAYTFLNAGLYLAVMMNVGRYDLAAAAPQGWGMFVALVVGVLIADLVMWLSGAESELHIHTEGQPLWPLDSARLGRCLQLAATVGLTQIVTNHLALPSNTSVISVMLLTIAPDLHATIRKGELRFAGALLAMVYASLSLLLLMRMPHFVLMLVLLFLGMFLAAYLARTGGPRAYAGVQMGLVLPMILVVPPDQIGSLEAAAARGAGVIIALACTLVVGGLSSAFASAAPKSTAA